MVEGQFQHRIDFSFVICNLGHSNGWPVRFEASNGALAMKLGEWVVRRNVQAEKDLERVYFSDVLSF